MPRSSERSRLLELVELDGLIGLKCARSKDEFDKEMESVTQNLELIFSTRFSIPKARISNSHEWLLQVLPQLDNDRFKQQLRVTRDEFNSLLALIVEDPLFSSKTCPQITPGLQLAIVLYRFGHYGTGASYANVAAKFGIGDGGSIIDITKRVITAILKLKPRFLYWPNKDERIMLASRVEDVLPGCIGFVDGTHVNLEERPSTAHPDDYFSRKQRYGLQLQAVCDVNLTIRHFVVGYTASVHDAKVYNSCCLALEPDKYFTNDQWLAGDAAYKLTETVLTPFRKNSTVQSASER